MFHCGFGHCTSGGHLTGRTSEGEKWFSFLCVCATVHVCISAGVRNCSLSVVTSVVFLHLHRSFNPIKPLPCKFEMTHTLLYRIFFILPSLLSSRYLGKVVDKMLLFQVLQRKKLN